MRREKTPRAAKQPRDPNNLTEGKQRRLSKESKRHNGAHGMRQSERRGWRPRRGAPGRTAEAPPREPAAATQGQRPRHGGRRRAAATAGDVGFRCGPEMEKCGGGLAPAALDGWRPASRPSARLAATRSPGPAPRPAARSQRVVRGRPLRSARALGSVVPRRRARPIGALRARPLRFAVLPARPRHGPPAPMEGKSHAPRAPARRFRAHRPASLRCLSGVARAQPPRGRPRGCRKGTSGRVRPASRPRSGAQLRCAGGRCVHLPARAPPRHALAAARGSAPWPAAPSPHSPATVRVTGPAGRVAAGHPDARTPTAAGAATARASPGPPTHPWPM